MVQVSLLGSPVHYLNIDCVVHGNRVCYTGATHITEVFVKEYFYVTFEATIHDCNQNAMEHNMF